MKARFTIVKISSLIVISMFMGLYALVSGINFYAQHSAEELFNNSRNPSSTSLLSIENLGTANHHPYHQVHGIAKYAAEAGFRWIRLSAFWDQIEPTQGHFNFQITDNSVNEAVAKGLKIVLQIHPFFPSWIEGNAEPRNCWIDYNCSNLPQDKAQLRAQFRDYVRAIVNRYRDRIQHFKIWSEPDGVWFFRGTADEYVDNLLIPASQEIRSIDPNLKVLGPGVFSSVSFLDKVLTRACNAIDIITVHTYHGTTLSSRLSKIVNYANMVEQRCHKPIWVSEFGFKSSDIGNNQQGPTTISFFQQALAIPRVEKVLQFLVYDTPTDAPGAYGFVTIDVLNSQFLGYKPSFYDLKNFLMSLPDGYNMSFDAQIGYYDDQNKLKYQIATSNQPVVSITYDARKPLTIRTRTSSIVETMCLYTDPTSIDSIQNQCNSNGLYTFPPHYFDEKSHFNITVGQKGQFETRSFVFSPINGTTDSHTFNFKVNYVDSANRPQQAIANSTNPNIEVTYNKNKPISFTTITAPGGNATCEYTDASSSTAKSCHPNTTYNFTANHFSGSSYWRVTVTRNGVSKKRVIRFKPNKPQLQPL